MLDFKIIKKSKKSRARLGLLKTSHGVVETPCFVPVATQATIKTLNTKQVEQTKSQLLICNTFHLHLKPNEEIVKSAGGLHKFMNWRKPLMTDSGGFQVFSLGFGRDLNIGKIAKPSQISQSEITAGKQPKSIKITQDGVYFQSPIDGRKLFLGPKESIKIQEKLGADIIFAFDECPPPNADYEYIKKSLEKTHKWAELCLQVKKGHQALYGIVQGGKYKDLRIQSAKFIGGLNFDGFGIGGEFGNDKKSMENMLNWVMQELPEEKPRHLLGIGYLEDIPKAIKAGIDTFDCIVPTRFARHNIVFTSEGKLDLSKTQFLKDKNPIDKKCSCFACQNYRRNYVSHLLRAKEMTAFSLMTFHNLYFFNNLVGEYRKLISIDKL